MFATYLHLDKGDIAHAKKFLHEAIKASPYLYYKLPIIINSSENYDKKAYIKLNAKAYVFDHRYEFRFVDDVIQRFQTVFSSENFASDYYEK
ncbi:MAG: hypothetical protein ACLFSQ_09395 [Candidatus Zixiibacteriota bacterium]